MKTTNSGTALTPRMQAAVERRKAHDDAKLFAADAISASLGGQCDDAAGLRDQLATAEQAIRDRDAKIAALETVVADARALAKTPCPHCATRESFGLENTQRLGTET